MKPLYQNFHVRQGGKSDEIKLLSLTLHRFTELVNCAYSIYYIFIVDSKLKLCQNILIDFQKISYNEENDISKLTHVFIVFLDDDC